MHFQSPVSIAAAAVSDVTAGGWSAAAAESPIAAANPKAYGARRTREVIFMALANASMRGPTDDSSRESENDN